MNRYSKKPRKINRNSRHASNTQGYGKGRE